MFSGHKSCSFQQQNCPYQNTGEKMMALTHERAYMLSEILATDIDMAKTLLKLSPSEAVAQLNALGHTFTVEEIKEYGQALRLQSQDESNNKGSNNVSGGSAFPLSTILSICNVMW